MVTYWIALDPDEADEAMAGRRDVWELVEEPGRCVDVDKAWHGVHAVLTGTADEHHSTLGLSVLGGTEFGGDEGYGPARLLSPQQVAEVSVALDELGPVAFEDQVDLALLAEQSVYPSVWDDTDEATELRAWLLESFVQLASAYRRAAGSGQAMAILIT